jgi:hypothetical protein
LVLRGRNEDFLMKWRELDSSDCVSMPQKAVCWLVRISDIPKVDKIICGSRNKRLIFVFVEINAKHFSLMSLEGKNHFVWSSEIVKIEKPI